MGMMWLVEYDQALVWQIAERYIELSGSSTPTPPSTPCDRPIVRGNGQSHPLVLPTTITGRATASIRMGVAAALAVAAGCVAELFFVP